MKCENCKWWEIIEDDEQERKIIQEGIDRIRKEVDDFLLSKGKLLDNESLAKKYCSMFEDKDILDAGRCHRYPPIRQLEDPEGDEIGYAWFGVYPITAKYQYCGEFKEK
jgi:hypothetical protein